MSIEESEWQKIIRNNSEILIFGQADYASRVESYIKVISDNKIKVQNISLKIKADKPDSTEFDFVEAEDVLRRQKIAIDIPVFLAFSVKFHDMALKTVQKIGFKKVILYDANIDNCMKKVFFKKKYKDSGKVFKTTEDFKMQNRMKIYVARSIYDKKVEKEVGLSPYETEIQVGAAIANKHICSLTDDTGDNISDRNKRFCEMTAAYWAWKNSDFEYIGLSHYRRRFNDPDNIAHIFELDNKIDAILPLPTLAECSVYEDYLKKHITDVYPVMLDVLYKRHPEIKEDAEKVWNGKIFYASNMWILKKNILDKFCAWMFPMLFEIEQQVAIKFGLEGSLPERDDGQTAYYNRYAGFCSERLETLWFLSNADRLNIVHAEKYFIS